MKIPWEANNRQAAYKEVKKMSEYRKLKSLKFLYEINDEGVLRNVKSKKIVHGHIESNGYRRVRIENKCLGGVIRTSIHQLVAEAFIPNPENKPFVNHIDLNKLNNHVSNLEWVTHSENMKHAYAHGVNREPLIKWRESEKKKVTNGEMVFDSIADAAKFLYASKKCKNLASGAASISAVCRGKRKLSGGYHWEFV